MTERFWTILSMDTVPSQDGLTDVVSVVYARRNAKQVVDEKEYLVEQFEHMPCQAPDPMAFTPYADLTFEQVCSWLDANLDVPAIDAQLDAMLSNLITPPVVQLPLPWIPEPSVDETPIVQSDPS